MHYHVILTEIFIAGFKVLGLETHVKWQDSEVRKLKDILCIIFSNIGIIWVNLKSDIIQINSEQNINFFGHYFEISILSRNLKISFRNCCIVRIHSIRMTGLHVCKFYISLSKHFEYNYLCPRVLHWVGSMTQRIEFTANGSIF